MSRWHQSQKCSMSSEMDSNYCETSRRRRTLRRLKDDRARSCLIEFVFPALWITIGNEDYDDWIKGFLTMHLAQVSSGLVMIEVHVSGSFCAFELESIFSAIFWLLVFLLSSLLLGWPYACPSPLTLSMWFLDWAGLNKWDKGKGSGVLLSLNFSCILLVLFATWFFRGGKIM